MGLLVLVSGVTFACNSWFVRFRYIYATQYFRLPALDTAVNTSEKLYITQTQFKTFLRHSREKQGFLRLFKALKMDKPI